MLSSRLRHQHESVLLVVAAFSLVLLLWQLADYDDQSITDAFKKASFSLGPDKLMSGVGSGAYIEQELLPLHQSVLLPARWKFDKATVKRHLQNTASRHWPMVQPEKSLDRSPDRSRSRFVPHEPFNLYHSAENWPEDQCDKQLNSTVDSLEVNSRETLPGNFTHILQVLLEEHDDYKDPYYQEIAPLFMKSTRIALEKDLVNAFWYRLSGSSVWLKDHNVHLLVLRFLYLHHKARNDPKASFVLVQVFDENWKEIQDVRLVFPTNKLDDPDAPGFESDGQHFHSYRFPRLMPVPFYNDYGTSNVKYLGPEDPRVILIKNPDGYEEPLIVFNAEHHKMAKDKNGKEEDHKYRSMFMSRLFQLQKGKGGLETKVRPLTNEIFFARTEELGIKGVDRPRKAKNWTPVISDIDRQHSGGHDKSILFVTQVKNLAVVKCDLVDKPGECEVLYKRDGDIGEMRGGTPLLSVNSLLREKNVPLNQILPRGREVFVGFARAHLTHCGCGVSFYRPNLLVVTKDEVEATVDGERETKYLFKVSHISGFLSLHVPIDPWHIDKPYAVCQGVNALIPNGVSDWLMEGLDIVNGQWTVKDRMSIAFSVSDFSVDRVEVKGILNALLNVPDKSLFLQPPGITTIDMSAFLPQLNLEGKLKDGVPGYSNTNVGCAIRSGKDFCKKFGQSELVIEDEHRHEDTSIYKTVYDNKVKEYDEAFKKAEEEKGPFY